MRRYHPYGAKKVVKKTDVRWIIEDKDVIIDGKMFLNASKYKTSRSGYPKEQYKTVLEFVDLICGFWHTEAFVEITSSEKGIKRFSFCSP